MERALAVKKGCPVGFIKEVVQIYKQSYINTYTQVVFTKLYTSKSDIASDDILNDRGLLFVEEYGTQLLLVMSDRGADLNGKPEHHEYELYSQILRG